MLPSLWTLYLSLLSCKKHDQPQKLTMMAIFFAILFPWVRREGRWQ
jgi:hypothetical protein